MALSVKIARGAVYIPAEVYLTHFRSVAAAAVIVRDGKLLVLPILQMAAGGALLKIRNAAGDRVVAAPDVFAEHGLQDWHADGAQAHWSDADGALIVPLPPQE